jgi:copper chaperone
MAEVTNHLATSGMHCSSCSMLIDMTLADLEGVTDSRTDHASGETVVTYDEDALDLQQIIEAIRSVGYEATIIS